MSEILELIRKTVKAVSPMAEIYLFGSRARGTNREDSDWDVFVLIDTPQLTESQKDIDYQLWTKGLELGQEINTVIRTKKEWEKNVSLFKYNIKKDAIRL